jgi:hypothetical protein
MPLSKQLLYLHQHNTKDLWRYGGPRLDPGITILYGTVCQIGNLNGADGVIHLNVTLRSLHDFYFYLCYAWGW